MNHHFMQRLALFGVMGGMLMLFGDMCFYMSPVSGANFSSAEMMRSMPPDRLIIGGVVGPLAGLLYALGTIMYYLAFRGHEKRLARIMTTLFVVMFVVGGAYHSIYTTYGFVPPGDLLGATAKISALIGALQKVSFVAGLSGSILFIYMVLRYDTVFPKWIIIFTPTFWTLLNGPLAPYIPYPAGSVVVGGWINICFILFFMLCYFMFGKAGKGGETNV